LDDGPNLKRGRVAAAALASPTAGAVLLLLVGEDEAPGLARQNEEYCQVKRKKEKKLQLSYQLQNKLLCRNTFSPFSAGSEAGFS